MSVSQVYCQEEEVANHFKLELIEMPKVTQGCFPEVSLQKHPLLLFKISQQADLKQGGAFICLLYVYLLKRYTFNIMGVENKKKINWMPRFYTGGKKGRG